MSKYWQILILIVLAMAAIFLIPKKQALAPSPQITDFATCKQAGGNISDSEQGQVCTPPSGECCFLDNTASADVVVDVPASGTLVKSPMTVSGRARGQWFFEANLPVVLKDSKGKVLAQKGFTATSDWMTTDYVPFSGILEFAAPETEFGVLIINRDNPSDMRQFDASFAVPVRFK